MPGEITFGIRLVADGSGYVGAVRLAASETAQLSKAARDAGKDVAGMGGSLTGAIALGSEIGRILGDAAKKTLEWAAETVTAAAELKDMSDATGSSVEDLSRLVNVAKISGVSMGELSIATQRLAVNLAGTDDESLKTSKALKALGVDTKDPAQAMEQLATKLATYADGANKAALVQEVLGRGAQRLLPYLKDLAEQQGIGATVTTHQAEEAEKLEKGLRALSLQFGTMRDALLSGVVPVLTEFLAQMTDGIRIAGGFYEALRLFATLSPFDTPAESLDKLLKQLNEAKAKKEAGVQKPGQGGLVTEGIFFDIGQVEVDQSLLDRDIADYEKKIAYVGRLRAREQLRDPLLIAQEDRGYDPRAQAPPPPPKTAGVDAFAAAWKQVSQILEHAQQDLEDVGKASDEKTSPAMRKLIDLIGSPEWAKFSAKQQQAAQDALLTADGIQHETAARVAAFAAGTKFSQMLAGTLDGLGKQNTALEHTLESLNNYGVEATDAAEAAARYNLENGETAKVLAVLDATMPDLANAIRETTIAEARRNDELRNSITLQKAYIAAVNAHLQAEGQSVQTIVDEIEKERLRAASIGLTRAEIVDLTIAREEDHLATLRGIADSEAEVAAAELRIAKLRELRGAITNTDDIEKAQKAGQELFQELDNLGRQAFESIGDKGTDTFKQIGQSLKKYVLDLLYQMTLRPFLVQIAASITGGGVSGIAQAAGGGGYGNLFSAAGNLLPSGTGTAASSLALQAFGGFGTEQAGLLAAQTADFGIAGTAATLEASGTVIGEAAGTFATAAGVMGAAIPILGLAIAAYSYFAANKKPSEVRGQFQVGGTNFEDNVSTPSPFGALGFSDAGTQQFSGEAAQLFNKIVAGALDAFASRYSPEQSARLADILQHTTFASESGTFTTQDFLEKYGGAVLQQVLTAAFDVLDPALGSVIKGFHGTADEVAKFGNTLLGVYDATKAINNADFTANVDAALQGANQETADKVLSFVAIVQTFGESIDGLGPQLEALDPASITAFVDALGGAQQAFAAFAYLNANFTTSADKATQAQSTLTKAWDTAGVTMDDLARAGLDHLPRTHAEFLKLLGSLDGNTEHGRTLANELLNHVAPAFVAVEGTADAAAQALTEAAQRGRDYFNEHFLTPEQQLAQRQTVDSTAIFDATRQTTLLGQALHGLGVDELPLTREGIVALRGQLVGLYGEGSDIVKQFDAVLPSVGDLIDSVGGFGDAATDAAQQVSEATNVIVNSVGDLIKQAHASADTLLGQFSNLAGESTGDFGSKLALQISLINDAIAKTNRSDFTSTTAFNAYVGELQASANNLTTDLARFTVLSAQYDAARAEQLVGLEQWYREQRAIFGGSQIDAQIASLEKIRATYERFAEAGSATAIAKVQQLDAQIAKLQASGSPALDALKTIFDQKWQAIVDGAQAAAASIDDFIKSIQGIANATGGNAGQQAALEQALLNAQYGKLADQYTKLDPTSAAAGAIYAQILTLKSYNDQLARQIAHYTTYAAQYGAATANQLVELENQFETWKQSVAGNAAALAIVTDIFNDRFKEIVDGIGDGVQSELDRLKQSIADYLKGLFVSDISPLSPADRLAQARAAFQQELTLAQHGDTKALGDITQYAQTFLDLDREFKAGSASFVADFNEITTALAALAGTQQNGLPLAGAGAPATNPTAALAAALPVGDKLASSGDVKAATDAITSQTVAFRAYIASLADAGDNNNAALQRQLASAATTIANSATSELK